MHAFDPRTPLVETLGVRSPASSQARLPIRPVQLHGLATDEGGPSCLGSRVALPVTLQPQYSLIVREIGVGDRPAVLMPAWECFLWSPLGGGWLSGKYKRTSVRPAAPARGGSGTRHGGVRATRHRAHLNVIDAVQKVAEDRGVSMAEVALRGSPTGLV